MVKKGLCERNRGARLSITTCINEVCVPSVPDEKMSSHLETICTDIADMKRMTKAHGKLMCLYRQHLKDICGYCQDHAKDLTHCRKLGSVAMENLMDDMKRKIIDLQVR